MAKRRKEEARKEARRARGGRAGPEEKLYNAEGSPAGKSAEDDKGDGFKRGGAARKRGGKVEGEMERERMDKRARGGPARGSNGQFARGGHVKLARGGTPYSSAHAAKEIDADDGHQGRMPKEVP